MNKTILTVIAVSLGASVIAKFSYDYGKLCGAIETGIKCFEMVTDLRNACTK